MFLFEIRRYIIAHKYTPNNFYGKLNFFKTKLTRILVFRVKHDAFSTNIISYIFISKLYSIVTHTI